jgi:hypothetical protein
MKLENIIKELKRESTIKPRYKIELDEVRKEKVHPDYQFFPELCYIIATENRILYMGGFDLRLGTLTKKEERHYDRLIMIDLCENHPELAQKHIKVTRS